MQPSVLSLGKKASCRKSVLLRTTQAAFPYWEGLVVWVGFGFGLFLFVLLLQVTFPGSSASPVCFFFNWQSLLRKCPNFPFPGVEERLGRRILLIWLQ